MTLADRLLRRTPEEVERLHRAAIARESGYGGLFGVTWSGGDVFEREKARRAFGDHWRRRIDEARERTEGVLRNP